MKNLFKIYFSILCFPLAAQLPETDVWLFQIKEEKSSAPRLEKPLNITSRPGYDNQPSFSADSKKIFYVTIGADKQADIFVYTVGNKKISQFTHSAESEYSPVQSGDRKFITTVLVEKDSTQRIHFINSQTAADEKKFDFDSVGYYTFLNQDT